MSNINKKCIVILGPTASGKTGFGLRLARELGGEIVSADSRQVFKYMDVGTGKDLGEYDGVPYHLIDVAHPNDDFDVMRYKTLAELAIKDIRNRGKLPIVVGGTGFYLQALVDDMTLSTAKPDLKLRAELEKLNIIELLKRLTAANAAFAVKLNNSERNNKRRLIRYIEIAERTPEFLATEEVSKKKIHSDDFILIGIKRDKEEIEARICKRLVERLEKEDMVVEVSVLHEKHGVEWKRLESFGLEYKFISQYLQEKIDYDEMVERLNIAIRQFAKRQMTWFRRWERLGAKIAWVEGYDDVRMIVDNIKGV